MPKFDIPQLVTMTVDAAKPLALSSVLGTEDGVRRTIQVLADQIAALTIRIEALEKLAV
jgi:hypothetical protein